MTPAEFTMKLELAFGMADRYHEGQTYGNNMPYTVHLEQVYFVLQRFGYHPFARDDDEEHSKLSSELLIAAILHDIVEDTEMTLKELKGLFGKRVASLVNGVTNEEGRNRKERHRKTYPKTKRIPGAIILKLADRIANIEACLATGDGRINMYRKEWEDFREALYVEGEHERMWKYIEKLLE